MGDHLRYTADSLARYMLREVHLTKCYYLYNMKLNASMSGGPYCNCEPENQIVDECSYLFCVVTNVLVIVANGSLIRKIPELYDVLTAWNWTLGRANFYWLYLVYRLIYHDTFVRIDACSDWSEISNHGDFGSVWLRACYMMTNRKWLQICWGFSQALPKSSKLDFKLNLQYSLDIYPHIFSFNHDTGYSCE